MADTPARRGGVPQEILEALYSVSAVERVEAIEAEHGVSLAVPIDQLATGDLKWRDFADAIMRQGKTPQEAQEIRDRVYREVLADILPKMDADAAPPTKPFADVCAALVEALGGLDERQQSRLQAIAESFLRNARTEAQTRDALTRSPKIGGIGLSGTQADATVQLLSQQRGFVAFADHTSVQEVPPATLPADALALTEDETRQVALHAREVPARTSYDATVDKVLAAIGATFKRRETEQRFRAALVARFRDVRDAQETRDFLTRSPESGGLGMRAETAAKIVLVVERAFQDLHHVSSSARKPVPAASRRPSSAAASFVPSTPAPTTPIVRTPPARTVVPPPPPPSFSPPPRAAEGEGVNTTPPSLTLPPPEYAEREGNEKSSFSPPPRAAGGGGAGGGEVDRKAAMPALPSQPPAATSTPRPAGPQALRPSGGSPSGKRKIVDVRPPRPRLIGPIEELETLTVEDFRKIRGTPAEVAQRIAQKLDILEKQSYAQRATGLRALRASPLMTAYADILNTALAEGKKVDDVIAAAGTLTKEEFSALREMSSTIRT